MSNFLVNTESNICDIGSQVTLTGKVNGNNNKIVIKNAAGHCNVDLIINGDGNEVFIDAPGAINGLAIRVGNHVHAHKTILKIGSGFSNEGGGVFLLYNSGNKLIIGKSCMFSKNVTIRCGDSPHLLFDRITGEYLDISDGVEVGNHVWIGEEVYITKKVTIPSECIVGAKSVVTKRFDKEYCAIAGNPARVVRENVEWVRNHAQLVDGSNYQISYEHNKSKYK